MRLTVVLVAVLGAHAPISELNEKTERTTRTTQGGNDYVT